MNKRKDLIGKKFGKLIVLEIAPNILHMSTWKCLCDCGNIKIVKTNNLLQGSVKSCGCLYNNGKSLKSEQKINRLTTKSYKNGKWTCQCDCGNFITIKTEKLNNNNTKSCGCLKIEQSSKNILKAIEKRRKFTPHIFSARRAWSNYKYRDSQCIKFEDFYKISQMNCFYCGDLPNNKFNYFDTPSVKSSIKSKSDGMFIYNGIDRIDNLKNHTLDNIVPCCKNCNRAKSDRSISDFLLWIKNLKTPIFKPINITNLSLPINKSKAMSIKCIFYNYKKDTDLNVEEYYSISQMNCFYCDVIPENIFNKAKTDKKASQRTKENGDYIYNGIDRIDSNLPHIKNNIVPCCYNCNRTKSNFSLPEFYNWINRIQKFQKEKAE